MALFVSADVGGRVPAVGSNTASSTGHLVRERGGSC
jgi:hypothetical protein